MSVVATYNGVTLDPLETWNENVTKKFAQNGKAVVGYTHVLSLRGTLDASNATGKATSIDDIFANLRESGQDLTITQGGTTILEVLAADVQGTGPWSDYALPGTEAPTKVGFNVPVILRLEFVTDPPTSSGGTVADTYNDTVAFDKQLCRTYTRRGSLSTESGTSAIGKFEGTDPQSALPSGQNWELESKEYNVDDDDQNLSYTWVYREYSFANPTTAKDITVSVSSTVREGLEVWSASGRLGYECGTTPNLADVQTILDNVRDWPGSAGKVIQEDIDTDDRENTISFAIALEKPYGSGGILEYEESVQTVTEQATKDFHAQSQQGRDKRQVLHNPVVTITHTWRIRQQGKIPDPINPVVDPQNADGSIIKKEFTNPRVSYDTKGAIAHGELSGVYTIVPLNNIAPGAFRNPVPPSASNPLQGQTPSRAI